MLDNKVKRTLKCMLIGTTIYNIILLIVSIIAFLIFYKTKNFEINDIIIQIVKNAVCVMVGYLCSLLAIYSMAISIEKAVAANDDKYAKRHMIFSTIVRLAIFCIILIIIINENTFGIVGGLLFLLSTIGIKIGAYLAPIIDKKI